MADRKIMKENIGDNTTKSSLSDSVIIHWKWDKEKKYRNFLGLRFGGNTEKEYDLKLKYGENPLENESVLFYFEHLAEYSLKMKKSKIKKMLASGDWGWNPDQKIDFDKEIDKLLK
ncbi:hypothetical protein DSECCO2_424400 [anaerobic digester metagenome]